VLEEVVLHAPSNQHDLIGQGPVKACAVTGYLNLQGLRRLISLISQLLLNEMDSLPSPVHHGLMHCSNTIQDEH
jgi:hypothetical protein